MNRMTIIMEEPEGLNQNDTRDATDSLSGMVQVKEDNLTFPRRTRCSKTSTRKVDWAELLAKATEEDKKANIDITHPTEENSDSDDELENKAPLPLNLSSTTPKCLNSDMVLDLSAMNRTQDSRSARKGYTVPTYDSHHKLHATPLKELNHCAKVQSTISLNQVKCEENIEATAKKNLFPSNELLYEREVVTHRHVSVTRNPKACDAPNKELGVYPGEHATLRHQADYRILESRFEGVREYGYPGNGMYNQNYENSGPSLRVQPKSDSENPHQQIVNEQPQDVFAIPDPPQRYKPTSKELIVNGKSYQILALLGKGGSSKVYLVLAKDNSLLAIKCVNLNNVDEKTKMDHLNEIEHLMKMQYCKHIIKIIDHQYVPSRNLLYAVMERGDTDLSRLLKERTTSGEGIPPEMIMFYWTEILLAVKSIHDNNIIHRDLKPANFLLVAGRLKLIDFGIASAIQSEQTSVFKDSQSGTPNYMSPEAWEDLGVGDERVVRIGRKTDVWSLGCILYSFLYGKTPFQEFGNPMAKFRAITNPHHKIPFPPVRGVPEILIESCRRCLVYNKDKRASIDELLELKSQILMTPPEVIAKLRLVLDDEAFEKAKHVIMHPYEGV